MKKSAYSLLLILFIFTNACVNGQNTGHAISPNVFEKQLKETPEAILVDVRTPEEFEGGHLKDARNINWNNSDFSKEVEQLDKSKPVYIYCLSGGRSAAAAASLRKSGFQSVTEMEGGMMKWRAAGLPEVSGKEKAAGMTTAQFEDVLKTDKIVLIDFYADWCAPCKKMKPYLEEIERDMSDKVKLVRINADENPELCSQMNVEGLPVLMVYKNQQLTWQNLGYIDKAGVLPHLK